MEQDNVNQTPEAPVITPGVPTAPIAPDMVQQTPMPEMPQVVAPAEAAPVAPVTPPVVAAPVAPVEAAPVEAAPVAPQVAEPVVPDFAAQDGIGATDPITMPEGPKAPDPVEEELKMPLKAAEPVPGSIGSAVSVGADGNVTKTAKSANPFANFGAKKQTPSVAFNDPATQPQANQAAGAKPAKKKTSKNTLILAIVLGVVVIAALVAVLIMQM